MIKRGVVIGVVFGLLVSLSSMIFIFVEDMQNYNLAYFLIGVGLIIVMLPFVISSISENKIKQEKDEMFLEFSRSLVESVDSGTPISKSIVNMNPDKFGALGVHIEKLANQIQLGIPLQKALQTFAYDTKSKTIIRAITLIREADKTGGDINTILEAVAKSVAETEKLKAERKAAISSIVMEGYIIFFIFIIIMLVVEVQILPMTSGMTDLGGAQDLGALNLGGGARAAGISDFSEFSIAFLSLLVVQGFFAGIIIGKLSEGNVKAGIKHSFILVAMAILMSTGSKLIF